MTFGQSESDATNTVLIACFLVIHGADLYTKNLKGSQPIELCPDPNLARILEKYAKEFQRYDKEAMRLYCYQFRAYNL